MILEITILPFHQRLRARQHQFHGQTCKGLHEGKSLSHHSRGNVASWPGSVCTLPPHPFRCCHYVQDMNKGLFNDMHTWLVWSPWNLLLEDDLHCVLSEEMVHVVVPSAANATAFWTT